MKIKREPKIQTKIYGVTQKIIEWDYVSNKVYFDPFNEIELDVIITYEDGRLWTVPAFWAGQNKWKVRFSAPTEGIYKVISICSDVDNIKLHHVNTILTIKPYTGTNPLYRHGAIQIDVSKKYFQHADSTPFFWLGDTWWMGLSKRLSWPDNFTLLTSDRAQKGFSVIQIVAGLLPDMDSFDERGANEAGFPWIKDYKSINPQYFDMADLRIDKLVSSGLVPCILGSWGYYLLILGIDKMKQHWRYIIARWGAYPVIWGLAGEIISPYYLSTNRDIERKQLRDGWAIIGDYIKKIDPYSRLLTVHPTHNARNEIKDDSLIDFNMIQAGHSSCKSIQNIINTLRDDFKCKIQIPIVIGEVNYEGILNSNYSSIQRLTFWAAILSGAQGFTYGANGLWQVNQEGKPFGSSPGGRNWGNTPWNIAYQLNGGKQIALASKLLRNYTWWDIKSHPEWISIQSNTDDLTVPLIGGIPKKLRIVYYVGPKFIWNSKPFKSIHFLRFCGLKFICSKKTFKILNIESDIKYKAYFWNPQDGKKSLIGLVNPDINNAWQVPKMPTLDDWLIILERVSNHDL